jgi:filamentous hemagglutinin family protein
MSSLIKVLCLSAICSFTIAPTDVKAQITPDDTVNTQTQQEDNNVDITGGEREGNNLFHSFEEFSIPTGEAANFKNDTDIENIFTRVTGEGVSNIDGLLRAQGSANLFLMNPNGIVFGENASLDIGGSFVGTTANSIEFADGNQFSSDDTSTTPVLTVSVPVGLGFMGNSPGPILVNGAGSQITTESSSKPTSIGNNAQGLQVPSGKTLALIGSNLELTGGILTTSGRIELGSLGSGKVTLNPTTTGWNFGYGGVSNFKDIELSKQALVNASGAGDNSIGVSGANVKLNDGSKFLIQNTGDTPSGSLSVNASNSLRLQGSGPDNKISSGLQTEALNSGKAGDISVTTEELILKGGGRISAGTYGNGEGGNIAIDARNSAQLLENTSNSISSSAFAQGDAGNIQLSTPDLRVTDGGTVTSSTTGDGFGGEITINADSLEVIGVSSTGGGLNRSNISSSSFAAGNAGSLKINTAQLRIKDGGTVGSTSFAAGDAGSVFVNSSESIDVSGVSEINNNFQSSIKAAVAPPVTEAARNALRLPEVPSGNSGNLTIKTPSLDINSGGTISVENQGTGNGGTLSIDANSVNLDNTGNISATSASGNGGNINIKADRLSLDEQSQVTATAANNGNGGNINIKTILLEAKKNSDITANAFEGKGGNITIDTKTIFRSPDSDITASSARGISGTVNFVNSPEEIEKYLILELPGFMDTNKLIADSCLDPNYTKKARQLEFVNKRGGVMPVNPDSGIDINETEPIPTVQKNIGSYATTNPRGETVIYPSENQSLWTPGEPVIEANEIVQTNDGRILGVRKIQPQEASSLVCH